MPTLPAGDYPRWEDDDDDGTLDVFNVQALRDRINDASRAEADRETKHLLDKWANSPPVQWDLAYRHGPLTENDQVSSRAPPRLQANDPTPSEPSTAATSSNRRRRERARQKRKAPLKSASGEEEADATSTAQSSLDMTANGVPLLPLGGTRQSEGVDPVVWNSLAGEISSGPAAAVATQLLTHMRAKSKRTSEDDADANPNLPKKQPKQRRVK
jgi:hypothetical protein